MKYIILIIITITSISCNKDNVYRVEYITYTNYVDIIHDNYYTNYFTNYTTLHITNYYTNNTINIYEYEMISTTKAEYEYIYKINELYYKSNILKTKKTNNYFENITLTLETKSKYEILINTLKRTYPNGQTRIYTKIYWLN